MLGDAGRLEWDPRYTENHICIHTLCFGHDRLGRTVLERGAPNRMKCSRNALFQANPFLLLINPP